jgi:hypothetical protein
MVCAIVQRHPRSVVALADAVGVPLPEHDDVASAADSHPMQDGDTVYTDATVRLLRDGKPVFFATVEMQRKFGREKYVTLHAYHGSGVRNTDAGGHVFVLSDKASAAERFRTEDTARRADLAFAASFHSGQDLKPLQEAELPLGARALPAALADFRADLPGTLGMLDELSGGDLTLANLYLRAIVEEVPMTMLGEVLQQDMFEKLRELESFRAYEAKVKAEADAAAAVAADAQVAEAQARAAKEAAEAQARAAREAAEARAREVVQDLQSYFMHKGDAPTLGALEAMNACTNVTIARYWLNRAYAGETSAEIFPDRDGIKEPVRRPTTH